MTRTMEKERSQANDYQCPNCRSVHDSQILCCKCGQVFRLNHNKATCWVCDTIATILHLKYIALSRTDGERLKGGLRSWSCCILLATMTMPNSDLLHPPASNDDFCVTFQSLLTCSGCHIVIRKSRSTATCTTCGQSRHLACTYLSRWERESICDGCREWRCCVTAQSLSTSTMPSRNHLTPSQSSESTMLHEVTIIHPET